MSSVCNENERHFRARLSVKAWILEAGASSTIYPPARAFGELYKILEDQ